MFISRVFIMALLIPIIGCGGGNTNNNGGSVITDGDEVKEVLPFGLESDDAKSLLGKMAVFYSAGAWVPAANNNFTTLPVSESENSNPLLVEFIKPECSTGILVYTSNHPDSILLSSTNNLWVKHPTFEISALNCVESQIGWDYIDGKYSGESVIIDDATGEESYKAELNSFVSNSSLDRGIADYYSFKLTGNIDVDFVYQNYSLVEASYEITSMEYEHAINSSYLFRLNKFSSHESIVNGARTIDKYSYTIKWDMVPLNILGKELGTTMHLDMDALTGWDDATTFPTGQYDLDVHLDSPIRIPSSHIYPTSGGVTVNLKSHNIKAEISYHASFAEVTYTRRATGVTKVRFDY